MKEKVAFHFLHESWKLPWWDAENMNEVVENAEARANKISKSINE